MKLNRSDANTTIEVSFDVANTGNFDSDEVTQLYTGYAQSAVERPARALKGFNRVFIKQGETKRITIIMKAMDLAFSDTETGRWVIESGKINVFIGSSSADIRLEGEINI